MKLFKVFFFVPVKQRYVAVSGLRTLDYVRSLRRDGLSVITCPCA